MPLVGERGLEGVEILNPNFWICLFLFVGTFGENDLDMRLLVVDKKLRYSSGWLNPPLEHNEYQRFANCPISERADTTRDGELILYIFCI